METYLDKLETISETRKDGGMIHGGHIHFIQQKLSDDWCFLKAAIYGILEKVPEIFPYDLPEQVEAGKTELTEKQKEALIEINSGLIFPIEGYDIIRVILAAREYEGKI